MVFGDQLSVRTAAQLKRANYCLNNLLQRRIMPFKSEI